MLKDSVSVLVNKNGVEAASRVAERSGEVALAGEIQTTKAAAMDGVGQCGVAG